MEKLIIITIVTASLLSIIFYRIEKSLFQKTIPTGAKKPGAASLDSRVAKLECEVGVLVKLLGQKAEKAIEDTKDKEKNNEDKDKDKEKNNKDKEKNNEDKENADDNKEELNEATDDNTTINPEDNKEEMKWDLT